MLYEVRVTLLEGLNIVGFMRAIYDALGTDGVTPTCKAVIADKFIAVDVAEGSLVCSCCIN